MKLKKIKWYPTQCAYGPSVTWAANIGHLSLFVWRVDACGNKYKWHMLATNCLYGAPIETIEPTFRTLKEAKRDCQTAVLQLVLDIVDIRGGR